MSDFDLTVAITAHAETLVAGPTMKSAEAAIAAAQACGIRVERLMGIDTPTEDCRAYFGQPAFQNWSIAHFELRDQGRARNALAKLARGRWLAFLDADDLFSENWLAEGARVLARAESSGDRVIAHPELNWIFDGAGFVFVKPPQDDRLFTHYYWPVENYYDALCMAPTRAFVETPYATRDLPGGFAYEDWQWNVEVIAAGWRHVVVADTVIFKRRRDQSQSHGSKRRGALIREVAPLAIDNLERLADTDRKCRSTSS